MALAQMRVSRIGLIWLLLLLAPEHCRAEQVDVTATVKVISGKGELSGAGAVVWLVPVGRPVSPAAAAPRHSQLIQKHKSFIPHLLVVQAGSAVDFPNQDPFFHNVFSLFNGKRFDLGLYEAGRTRTVIFDRPGICYIFCNIHPEMSAVVIVLQTPYFAISGDAGRIRIGDVPPGRYDVHIWDERALPSALEGAAHQVTINENSRSLGILTLMAAPSLALHHKNKYGQDYQTPSPDNPVYVQP
jgi:plastocyanin